jgi:endonuclease/exonuclease/phosphatase (EEP) superfamily protein YafD
MLPVLLVAILARRRWLALLGSLTLAFGAGPELLTIIPRSPGASTHPSLTLMSVNLMVGQSDTAALLGQIERVAPDVIVFQEWTSGDAAKLRPTLIATYPHAIDLPRDDAFGQAVFSRRPLAAPAVLYPPRGGFREPQITIAVEHAGKVMRITDVHLLPPINGTYFNEQRVNAAALAATLADPTSLDRPDVLAGDFNATLRSGILHAFTDAGMQDAHRIFGWWRGSTWPRVGVLAWTPGIQLDHVLCGPRVECEACHVGEDFGSDHRPVIARLRWR